MTDKRIAPEIPDHVIESFARCLLPAIREYFDSEEGQREFVQWKVEKERDDREKAQRN